MNLELISLRYLEQDAEPDIKRFLKKITEQGDIQRKWDIWILRRNRLYMEILIALVSKKSGSKKTKSDLGYLVAESLKSFGTVIHDVWSELDL